MLNYQTLAFLAIKCQSLVNLSLIKYPVFHSLPSKDSMNILMSCKSLKRFDCVNCWCTEREFSRLKSKLPFLFSSELDTISFITLISDENIRSRNLYRTFICLSTFLLLSLAVFPRAPAAVLQIRRHMA